VQPRDFVASTHYERTEGIEH